MWMEACRPSKANPSVLFFATTVQRVLGILCILDGLFCLQPTWKTTAFSQPLLPVYGKLHKQYRIRHNDWSDNSGILAAANCANELNN